MTETPRSRGEFRPFATCRPRSRVACEDSEGEEAASAGFEELVGEITKYDAKRAKEGGSDAGTKDELSV